MGHHDGHGGRDDPERPARRSRQRVGAALRLTADRMARRVPGARPQERSRRDQLARRAARAGPAARSPVVASGRGRDRSRRGQGRRSVSRRGRHTPRVRRDVHAHGLPAPLERRRAELGLPLPRLAFRGDRSRPERPRGPPVAAARRERRNRMSSAARLARRPGKGRSIAARGIALAAAAGLLPGCLHAPARYAGGNALAAAVAALELPEDAAVLVGGGDIADCDDLAGARATAELIELVLARATEAIVFTTGDHAYPSGTPTEYAACYAPTWGRFNARTAPTPGNHDYETPGASGYFAYFDVFAARPGARPTGYYAFEHGTWLVVVLNSLLAVEPGSAQLRWLEHLLAENRTECIVAIWHHPLRSSAL